MDTAAYSAARWSKNAPVPTLLLACDSCEIFTDTVRRYPSTQQIHTRSISPPNPCPITRPIRREVMPRYQRTSNHDHRGKSCGRHSKYVGTTAKTASDRPTTFPALMCGVIGILLGDRDALVSQELYDGLTILQHRGQDAAGIATSDGRKIHLRKNKGLVSIVTTHLFRDRAPLLPPIDTPPTLGHSLRFFHTSLRILFCILFHFCLAVCRHHHV